MMSTAYTHLLLSPSLPPFPPPPKPYQSCSDVKSTSTTKYNRLKREHRAPAVSICCKIAVKIPLLYSSLPINKQLPQKYTPNM